MNVLTSATDGTVLQGRLSQPGTAPVGAALILHPHPAFGGHMDVWLLPQIAERLRGEGWMSLRINFRGVEGSQGTQTGGRKEHLDALGALEWLRMQAQDLPLAVVGWSFGAMIGLRLGQAVDGWIGIGPPTRHVDEVPLQGALVPDDLPPLRRVIVGEHDQFFPPDTTSVLRPDRTIVVPGADHFMFDRDLEVANHVVACLPTVAPAHPHMAPPKVRSGPRLTSRFVVRITPADVGRRVSVRSALGEDDDGPRYTDTLGDLESWNDGKLAIRRRDGWVIEVAETSLVAGKIVPPPPPRRRPRA